MKTNHASKTLLSEMKFPEMYYDCDKKEKICLLWSCQDAFYFLWRFRVKIKTFFSSNSETSPFFLHLLSSIIAPLEMLIYSLFQAFRLRAVHSEQAGLFVKEV